MDRSAHAVSATRLQDDVYEYVREQFSEDELVHLSLAIVSINGGTGSTWGLDRGVEIVLGGHVHAASCTNTASNVRPSRYLAHVALLVLAVGTLRRRTRRFGGTS